MERDKIDIDLGDIFRYIAYRWWMILISMFICGVASFMYTNQFVTPIYQADTMLYVNASASVGDVTISALDVGNNKNLIQTYIVILKTRVTLDEISAEIDYAYDRTQLAEMITAAAVSSTDVLQIKVRNVDPMMAEKIAKAIATILPEQISKIIDGTSVRIVDTAVIPSKPISPDYKANTLVGAGIGAILCLILLLLRRLTESRVTSVDYLKDIYEDIPLLTVVPDIDIKK